jgi:hypothetical protein
MKAINFLLSIAVLAAAGCTVGRRYETGHSSHFPFPNSNVIPLGPAKAKVTTDQSFVIPSTLRSGDSDLKAFNAAISQVSGADILIDWTMKNEIKKAGPLPFFWTESSVEGTAAKMEIGRKKLK